VSAEKNISGKSTNKQANYEIKRYETKSKNK
jgi:hypothetical protein